MEPYKGKMLHKLAFKPLTIPLPPSPLGSWMILILRGHSNNTLNFFDTPSPYFGTFFWVTEFLAWLALNELLRKNILNSNLVNKQNSLLPKAFKDYQHTKRNKLAWHKDHHQEAGGQIEIISSQGSQTRGPPDALIRPVFQNWQGFLFFS